MPGEPAGTVSIAQQSEASPGREARPFAWLLMTVKLLLKSCVHHPLVLVVTPLAL